MTAVRRVRDGMVMLGMGMSVVICCESVVPTGMTMVACPAPVMSARVMRCTSMTLSVDRNVRMPRVGRGWMGMAMLRSMPTAGMVLAMLRVASAVRMRRAMVMMVLAVVRVAGVVGMRRAMVVMVLAMGRTGVSRRPMGRCLAMAVAVCGAVVGLRRVGMSVMRTRYVMCMTGGSGRRRDRRVMMRTVGVVRMAMRDLMRMTARRG
jgi:hypothetical protein